MHQTFRSLRVFNFRAWSLGAVISNVGTWMQRTAQDWLVLTELTHRDATAVGVVMALQFAPQVLLLAWTGYAADRFERRRLLFLTQSALALLALALGVLTLTGRVRLWQVYGLAFLLGCATAFDAPVRQAFVSELVGEEDLPNAVALNSTSFNAARMVGPAVAGLLIAAIGTGWVFVLNALSFLPVLVSLSVLRRHELRTRRGSARPGLAEGFRYVWRRPDLQVVLFMLFLVGTFGINFPIFLSTMAVSVFHKGPSEYGLLTSVMAVGSVSGALLAAARKQPGLGVLIFGAGLFGSGLAAAALMPSYALFAVPLVAVGLAAQTFTTTANATVQLATEPAMRGRVLAILLAIALGGTPIGAPIVGRVADAFGPRWALGVGALGCFMALAVGLFYRAWTAHQPASQGG